jgi:hypothetical protein
VVLVGLVLQQVEIVILSTHLLSRAVVADPEPLVAVVLVVHIPATVAVMAVLAELLLMPTVVVLVVQADTPVLAVRALMAGLR